MTALERKLNKAKPVLLKAIRRSDADFSFSVLKNREMENIRAALVSREDWKGREATKIASEDVVNVLAFPEPASFPHPESRGIYLGEIYLNRDFAKGRYDVLGPLFIHGLLHLLGYRHWTKRDTMKMQNMEKKLWAELISKIP